MSTVPRWARSVTVTGVVRSYVVMTISLIVSGGGDAVGAVGVGRARAAGTNGSRLREAGDAAAAGAARHGGRERPGRRPRHGMHRCGDGTHEPGVHRDALR